MTVSARHILLRDGGSIAADSESEALDAGESGSVFIRASDTFRLFNGSQISVKTEQADAGDIDLDVGFLLHLRDGSSIEIESPETDVVSGALALPESFLDATSLLSERCTARATKGASSFIVSGSGGVPPGPETVLPSPLELGADWKRINRGPR